ncbi:MAG: hypothetical protein U0836_14785 [Pirellulales bacterium]
MLGMTALCGLLAVQARVQHKAKAAMSEVQALGGMAWGEPVWKQRWLNWLTPSGEEWEFDSGLEFVPHTVYFHRDDWLPQPPDGADLEYMYFATKDLDDRGLERLVEVIQNAGTIQNLDLIGVSITDQGGRRLGELRHLHSLVLSGTAVGDETAASLAKCRQLESLDLDETQVSKAALERLRAALPRCKISWSPPPAPKPHK